jgi:hypothetical protein
MGREDGAKVDAVEYKAAGISVPVRLNKKTGFFNAEWGEKQFKNKDLTELKREVEQYLRESVTAEWKPIITAKATGGNRYSGHDNTWVGLEIDRGYVAEIAGALRWVSWDSAIREGHNPIKMIACSSHFRWQDNGRKFEPPITDFVEEKPAWRSYTLSEEPKSYLAYDEATWQGLTLMQAKIKQLREGIAALLASNQGQRLIAGFVSQLALPAPETKEE